MAGPLFLRGLPLLRLCFRLPHQHQRLAAGVLTRRTWCASAESTRPDEEVSGAAQSTSFLSVKDPPKYSRWDDPDYRKWKDKEKEILRDIEPITFLTKEILHSCRCMLHTSVGNNCYGKLRTISEYSETYMDGERLTPEDEKAVVEKLLAYHPRAEDKIGSGLDYIMVDRHPQFRRSRCLFVVRTDGVWIDFSYQKCLRAYVRHQYPSHAERFIKAHFKRESG